MKAPPKLSLRKVRISSTFEFNIKIEFGHRMNRILIDGAKFKEILDQFDLETLVKGKCHVN